MWNARLQLRNVSWYWVSAANRRATQSSLNGRSAEKYSKSGPREPASTPRKAASNVPLLEYWWLTGTPSTSSVGMDADNSFDMTTASRPSSAAASTAMAEM